MSFQLDTAFDRAFLTYLRRPLNSAGKAYIRYKPFEERVQIKEDLTGLEQEGREELDENYQLIAPIIRSLSKF